MNPCHEIPLGPFQWMEPEWQLMLMNSLRRQQGLEPYIGDKAKEILKSLKEQETRDLAS